ncbi:glycosyltransferase family 4 protein [Pseudomonas sp. MDMC216]|nr:MULTISPECIES: glycosyltransferase family 4 protein [unclassified Pseudomonas]MDI5993285.1 glycosyltransferase family 4 protein [Pseudomonas sp. MDMC216]MDI6006678.1 glycosyltransferase family 4 protein [Pseudomonas sp. MDMC17]PTC01079.1 glycosyltransferase WbuB [Thalassospira xiamenensis]RAR32210.1 glycosyltransferase WbuB [Pseudomonas sp. MDMC224]
MNKTIWYVTKYFSPKTANSPGGRGWFLVDEMQRAGYQVVVISSDSNNLVDLPVLNKRVTLQDTDGVRIVWLKTMKYSVAKSLRRILSWFHFEWNLFWLNKSQLPRPDVVIVSSLSLLTIINGLLMRFKYKSRLVFEVRDIWPLTIVEEGGYSNRNLFVRGLAWLERLAYRKSDAIVGTMPNLAAHVRNELGFGRPVFCVPMGVSPGHLSDVAELPIDYIDRYLSSEKFKVVHAGTIGITNALDVFFKAAHALRERSDIEFIIVGDGALRQSYHNQYGDLPNLVFAPKVPRNMVQAVLTRGNLLYFSVHDSKVWDYGQSLNKVIDYMLAAKPVVASYNGYPSMINESGCGVFVPANDVGAVVTAVLDMKSRSEEERSLMGLLGREWLLQNRNYSKLAREYLSILFEDEGS